MNRKKRLARKTKETDISVEIGLDGTGKYAIDLPDKWLKHMLESVARFGKFDLRIKASGDFGHHIIEDVGIALGKALKNALGDKPVQRVGSATLPMDDALVTVAIDLVDRPYCQVDLPDEMLEHFLRSLAMEARITLHSIILRGKNFHHINEATFKAFGMALHQATRPAGKLQSTKGRVRWSR
ncbi:MAG TPA: imidazoleglycerol-phosphate dehydratase [Planctomycetota bacterium]|nr:imidazoleglycerol-phosphate dehydratase [Planctomycetota bacterium]